MISTNISSKIVIIGTGLDGKGGIAVLLRSYSRILQPFYYICSHRSTNRIFQIGLAIIALFKTIFIVFFIEFKLYIFIQHLIVLSFENQFMCSLLKFFIKR